MKIERYGRNVHRFTMESGGFHVEKGRKPKPLGGMWVTFKVERNRRKGEEGYKVIPEFRKTNTFYYQ